MEFGSERYYKHSGAAPFGGILLSLVIGVIAGAASAFVYAFLNWYNPLIYITFLATCGVSLLAGMGVVFGLTLGKVRNRVVATTIGLITGISTLYFSWAFFLWVVSDYEGFVLNPLHLFEVIQTLGQIGLWEIKGGKPTGWGLYIFWFLEAGIIVLGPTILSLIHDNPFCEYCDSWADEHGVGAGLQVPHDLNELKRDLEDEQYDRLHELMQGSYDAENYLQLKVWMCPQCDESTWLTVEQQVTTTNAKGESSTSTNSIVNNLAISRELAEELLATVPSSGGGVESLLTDIPSSERKTPEPIPLAGDEDLDEFEPQADVGDDDDFWNTKKP